MVKVGVAGTRPRLALVILMTSVQRKAWPGRTTLDGMRYVYVRGARTREIS